MWNILILGKEQKFRLILDKVFGQLSVLHNVFVSSSAKEAYIKAMEVKMDLFVLNLSFSEDESITKANLYLIDKLRQVTYYRSVPFLFLGDMEDVKKYEKVKKTCDGFLAKPLDPQEAEFWVKSVVMSFHNPGIIMEHVYFHAGGILDCLEIRKIIYLKVVENGIHIQCVDRWIDLPYVSFEIFIKNLDAHFFLLFGKNTLVNYSFIDKVDFEKNFVQLKNNWGKLEWNQ